MRGDQPVCNISDRGIGLSAIVPSGDGLYCRDIDITQLSDGLCQALGIGHLPRGAQAHEMCDVILKRAQFGPVNHRAAMADNRRDIRGQRRVIKAASDAA